MLLFLFGAIFMAVFVWWVMPKIMVTKHLSKLPFDETVDYLSQEFTQNRWQVPKVYDIQNSLQKAGHSEMGRLKIISTCHPDHANEILSDESCKFVSAMMPCRISVYENAKGDVTIAQMNVSVMSKMFGGLIQRVMSDVAKEEKKIVQKILQ
ncbi:MAG TPA: DUF302 domain-containing protein [candidate division Zixibacteria bacterium]|nr:DUF302 domain-containing protein [candidate division Zixibacteria bacterium]